MNEAKLAPIEMKDMLRIKLITTGDMEYFALPESLENAFGRIFEAMLQELKDNGDSQGEKQLRKALADIEWIKPPAQPVKKKKKSTSVQHAYGATSSRLKKGDFPNKPMLKLAQAMLAEALDGKDGKPADLVIVVDDVELENLDQEAVIAEHFCTAVDKELDKKLDAKNLKPGEHIKKKEWEDVIRDKCSFHVLRPMAEAYLFGDSDALHTAGVAQQIAIKLDLLANEDVEQFETLDKKWWREEKSKAAHGNPSVEHEKHPKVYLKYLTLIKDASTSTGWKTAYRENYEGVNALKNLKWEKVSEDNSDNTQFIRALFRDITDWYDERIYGITIPNPIGEDANKGTTNPHFYPQNKNAKRLLRNM